MYYISPPLHSVKCYNVTKHFPHFSIEQFERPSLTGDFQKKIKKINMRSVWAGLKSVPLNALLERILFTLA